LKRRPSPDREAALVQVHVLGADDIAGTAALFEEMQSHYGVACPPRADIVRDITTLPVGVCILVATDPEVIGFAAFGAVFPGPSLRSGLFLKELYVSHRARGRGVGRKLMRAVARSAIARGFARVDWTADREDRRLLRFYEATGATAQTEKLFFRLAGQALSDFAASSSAEPAVGSEDEEASHSPSTSPTQ
jgi:GNAT superfamily N-acetyltransferase